jgi:hypothetical protein
MDEKNTFLGIKAGEIPNNKKELQKNIFDAFPFLISFKGLC